MPRKTLWALALLPAIAACAPQVETRLTLADIETVARTGATVEVAALLRIPQVGLENCREALAQLTRSLDPITPVTAEPECVDLSGDQFAQFETVLTLHAQNGAIPPATLLQVAVEPDEAGRTALVFSTARTLEDVSQAVGGSFSVFSTFPTFDETPRFYFDLDNTGSAPATLFVDHAFIDGEPVVDPARALPLPPGATVRVTLSDVASFLAADAMPYRFATVGPATP